MDWLSVDPVHDLFWWMSSDTAAPMDVNDGLRMIYSGDRGAREEEDRTCLSYVITLPFIFRGAAGVPTGTFEKKSPARLLPGRLIRSECPRRLPCTRAPLRAVFKQGPGRFIISPSGPCPSLPWVDRDEAPCVDVRSGGSRSGLHSVFGGPVPVHQECGGDIYYRQLNDTGLLCPHGHPMERFMILDNEPASALVQFIRQCTPESIRRGPAG